MLKELLKKKENNNFVNYTEKFLLKRFNEMIKKIPNNSWKNYSEILKDFTSDKNEKWGLRFYLLLSECLKKWAKNYKNSNFEKIYLSLKNNSLFYNKFIYYDSEYEKFNECDEKFFNLFHFNKKHKEQSIDFENKDNLEILESFEEIKKSRKFFLMNIFTDKIEERKLKKFKNDYENKILKNYTKIENFLENSKNNENIQEDIVKELELANNQLELYDNIFLNSEFNKKSIQNLRSGICNILIKIYGGYPQTYSKFLEKGKIVVSERNFGFKNKNGLENNNFNERILKNGNERGLKNFQEEKSLKKNNESEKNKKYVNEKILKNSNKSKKNQFELKSRNDKIKKERESPKKLSKKEIDNITSINKNNPKSRSRFSRYRNNNSDSISDIKNNPLINKFNYEFSQMEKEKDLKKKKKEFIKKKENFEKLESEIHHIEKGEENNYRNKFIRNKLLIEEFQKKEEKYQNLKKKYRNLCNQYKNKCMLDCYFTMESDKYTKRNL